MRATELFRCRFPSLMDARMMSPWQWGLGASWGLPETISNRLVKERRRVALVADDDDAPARSSRFTAVTNNQEGGSSRCADTHFHYYSSGLELLQFEMHSLHYLL